MATTLEQLTHQLAESGLISSDRAREVLEGLPADVLSDTSRLHLELVERTRLTEYQIQRVLSGDCRSLILGNYVVLDRLGQGGMGTVFKAEHRRMKRVVALKVLSPTLTRTDESVRRFQREVEAAAKLDHPQIVTAHDAGEADGVPFLVMQYVAGTDLAALVRESGPLPVDQALRAVLQAARGLEYAHQQGIIHRDIKPANLLLDGQGVVKILDLGLARILGDEHQAMTGSHAVMGTVDFMAPEQASGTRDVDARADIYSLGVTLWYLLTGRALFPGDSVVQKLMAHQNHPIPPLRQNCPGACADLETVFARMVAKRPEDRYPRMTDVIGDLERLLSLPAGGPARVTVSPASGAGTEIGNADWNTVLAKAPTRRLSGESPGSPAAVLSVTGIGNTLPRRGRRWMAILAGTLMLMCGAVLLLLNRGQAGALQLSVSGPDLEVSLKGTPHVFRTSEGWNEVSVAPGRQTLLIRSGERIVETDKALVSRGMTTTVSVELAQGVLVLRSGETVLERWPDFGTAVPAKSARATATAGWHGWPDDAPAPAIAPFTVQEARDSQSAWARHLGLEVEYANSLGMRFVLIPPGEFTMGSLPAETDWTRTFIEDPHWNECLRSESPRHRVVLTQPIYVGIHEVTQSQFEEVMGRNPSHFAESGPGAAAVRGLDTDELPVELVNWKAAVEFCVSLSQQEDFKPCYSLVGGEVTLLKGDGYRLLRESEWEFSCRGGTETPFWCGPNLDVAAQAAWFAQNSGERTHPVGTLKPNPFGLYDTHGNVWEWVEDAWEPDFYEQFRVRTAIDPVCSGQPGSMRVLRSGSWRGPPAYCRSAHRHAAGPLGAAWNFGFRIALMTTALRKSPQ